MTHRQVRPITFEVIRNQKSLCRAGLKGNLGVITAILHWVNRGRNDEIKLNISGHDSDTFEDLHWVNQTLKPGDAIVIRVIESTDATRPKRRMEPLTREFIEKQERAYLRKTAKKYGYKLVKASS
jgi:hypothetical protein